MELESAEAPHPKQTGHRWVDLLLTFSAICMSAVSLFLARDNSQAMERLVQANSRPFIQLGSGNATDDGEAGTLAFSARNAGTGPAQLYSFEFLVDDRPVPMRGWLIQNVASACCGEEWAETAAQNDVLAAVGPDLTSPVARTFLAPGDEATALRWARTQSNQSLWNAFDRARQEGRITMRACYCSLFDECWIAETNAFPPQPVGSCEDEANDAGAR